MSAHLQIRNRSIARLSVAALIAATFALGAAPATAGPPPECDGNEENAPDGKLNADGGPFEGAHAYPNESLDVSPVLGGEQVVFLLKWKNVSDSTRTIRVTDVTSYVTSANAVIKYFVGGVNVSKQVRQTHHLVFFGVQPGKRVTVEAVLKNRGPGQNFTGAELQGRYGGSGPGSCDELEPLIND